MSNDELLSRMKKQLAGDGPVEKQIVLLKLSEALEHAPAFGTAPVFDVSSPQRRWLAQVGALLSRLGMERQVTFNATMATSVQYWTPATNQIKLQVLDAIEHLKLELELDGRADIGSAYGPGEVYRFFADLKGIINSASLSLMIVDPYFTGEAFDAYLSSSPPTVNVRVLAEKYAKDIAGYVSKHRTQFKSKVELRTSAELHDRVVLVDDDAAWVMGGSIKDAGKKSTYLIPLASPIASAKRAIYEQVWTRAKLVS